ncbi:MAG: methionyl-tRNA formyltransferase [Flavobacteriaceae bacterium]
MSDMRIVFMGTPYFAVPSLQALINSKYKVVGVVTAPDRPAGRGQKLKMSDVKIEALKHDIPILQPTNLKSDEFLEELKILEANLFIVVAFRMLPKSIWQIPKYGTFNLHASLLPNYRGAAPINWAIINGETKTGVSTFFIDEKIDTGAVIFQEEVAIQSNETVGTLHDTLMTLGSGLILKTVTAISKGNIKTKNQPLANLKRAPKLNPQICKINWDEDITSIYNKIRGLNPYPTAWCFLLRNEQQLKLKIYDVTLEIAEHSLTFGSIIRTKKSFQVACKGGFLIIDTLQLAGKKRMSAQNFLNGIKLDEKAKLL